MKLTVATENLAQSSAQSVSSPPVFVVDGVRTPFLKAGLCPGPFSAADLATQAGQALLSRLSLPNNAIDEVILGCVAPRETEANIARIVGLRLGLPVSTPAWTVQRNCASGMQAIDAARQAIQLGQAQLVLAGGTEAMSHAPLLWSNELVRWLADFRQAGWRRKLGLLADWRWRYLAPIAALRCGLSDSIVGLSMGQTAEIVADRCHITREAMDQFALTSHQRALAAQEQGYFNEELFTLYDHAGHYYMADNGIRSDTSLDKLAKLKPFFEAYGLVTAGNSSQITDGAACLLLASEQAVVDYQLPVLGQLHGCEWVGIEPEIMGLGPALAIPRLLARHQLPPQEIAYWEINEAFAAQVLGCNAAWQDLEFCRRLGLEAPWGAIPLNRLNVDGGAIALGHPVGASGARIILHLLHILRRQQAHWGVAGICIGGGQGGALLVSQ